VAGALWREACAQPSSFAPAWPSSIFFFAIPFVAQLAHVRSPRGGQASPWLLLTTVTTG
jgi:hypothetical protein